MGTREFVSRLKECKAALFDLDGTVVQGNVSAGIGYGYLKREHRRGNWRNVLIGLKGGVLAEIYRRAGNESRGLEAFVDALNKAGCADRESAYMFADKYVANHGVPAIGALSTELIRAMRIFPVVYTGGLDVSAEAAADQFNFQQSFAIYTFSRNRIVTSKYADQRKRKDEAAERFLHEQGLSLSQCLVVGDAESDLPVMERAKLSMAAPYAKLGVRERANYSPESNFLLLTELRILDS